MTAARVLEDFLSWLRSSPWAAAEPHLLRSRPVELPAYREAFAQSGFPLPPSLAELVSRHGLLELRLPDAAGRDGARLCLADAGELFELRGHLRAARGAGVAQAEHWLLFASAGSLDDAWVLDDRFVTGEEPAVGHYHQDLVCTSPVGPDERLPHTHATLAGWLASLLEEVRARLAAVADLPAWLAQREDAAAATAPPAWARLEAERLDWGRGSDPRLRAALAHSPDARLVQRILAEIALDLDERPGRALIPSLKNAKKPGGGWPWDYPGPRDVFHRLPSEGRWGRRDVARWALACCGRSPAHPELRAAEALLAALCAGTPVDPGQREALLARCGALSSAGGAELERLHAEALALALGRAEPEPMHACAGLAITIAALVGTPAGQRGCLDARTLFEKLVKIVEGQPDLVPRNLRPLAAPAGLLGELEAWLASFAGTQRELLEALGREWAHRLGELADDEQAAVAARLRKAISSKKLLAERDRLLAHWLGRGAP